MVSSDSKYDKVMRKEKGAQFSEQEKNGLKIFRNNCAVCHKEPLFTSTTFTSNGLKMDSLLKDVGRYAITHNPTDSMLFKIPTLRNVELTYPYFHDGGAATLTEAVDIMGRLQLGKKFSQEENASIVAFLKTLTGEQPSFKLPQLPPSSDKTPRPEPFAK